MSKILLLDDSLRHRRAGVNQLTALGHEVVALCDYGEARERAMTEDPPFDVALCDLLMPAEPTTLGDAARREHVGREIGIGYPMVIELSHYVKRVAVATDTGHHDHPMSAIADWFRGRTDVINGAKVQIMHSPMNDGVKDWARVLERIMAA